VIQKRSIVEKLPFLMPKESQHRRPKKLKPKPANNLKSRFLNLRFAKKILFWGVILAAFLWIFWGIPFPTKLGSQQVPVSTKLYDRNGALIYEIYADKRSNPIGLENLPDYVWQSTISIEDKDFYRHYGVSFTGVLRALYKTAVERKLQGGSTLTQQLIKNTLLSPERTIRRKIREFALTLVAETIYSKNQILEMYLNQIPYGSTAYGIGAASELYFGKNAMDLSLAEAALLAGLPASPSRFSPFGSRPELAKERQLLVLQRMVEDGYIHQEDAEKAYEEELKFAETKVFEAPHFALWVKEQLAEKYGEAVTEKGGLRVTTTLDLELQNFAQAAVATEVAKLKNFNVGNGAALVTRPGTGEILAMVGSKDYFAVDEDGKVNVTLAERQPGSSIKPLNYALALRDKKITPATVLADVPTCFIVAGTAPYCPKNYDGGFRGGVQVRYALGNSYNIPAVRVLALNGIENFMDFASQMGITTWKDPSKYGLSLTLGGGEVKPYDMAEAFGVFANSGIRQPIISILKVEDWQGNVLEEVDLDKSKLSGKRVLESDVTYLISHILQDNNSRAAAFGTRSFLVVDNHPEVSVKTGTTNERRDNWTIGYTPHAVVVTWVGNNDNTQMSGAVSGVSGASPIWNTIMKEVLDKAEDGFYGKGENDRAWLSRPNSIVGTNVCITTGILPREGEGCATRFEYFLKDTVPTSIKGGFQDVHYDRRTGHFINDETPPEEIEIRGQNVIYDPLGTFLCIDCPISSASQSATVRYPVAVDKSN
jgi:penicillin-binding protein 1C